eukprot:7882999-Prorocentrum_lima.AAC.1
MRIRAEAEQAANHGHKLQIKASNSKIGAELPQRFARENGARAVRRSFCLFGCGSAGITT